jgi:hypothetical protein
MAEAGMGSNSGREAKELWGGHGFRLMEIAITSSVNAMTP